MEKTCTICGDKFVSKRPHMSKGVCSKNSCKSKRYYYENHEKQKERVLNNYYRYKETNYERIREINRKAKDIQRFGVSREKILKRDRYQCVSCGSKDKLAVHHKDHKGRGSNEPNNERDNLVTVCHSCHSSHHFGHRKLKV